MARRRPIPRELLAVLAILAAVALLFVLAGTGLIQPWRA